MADALQNSEKCSLIKANQNHGWCGNSLITLATCTSQTKKDLAFFVLRRVICSTGFLVHGVRKGVYAIFVRTSTYRLICHGIPAYQSIYFNKMDNPQVNKQTKAKVTVAISCPLVWDTQTTIAEIFSSFV